MITAHFHLMCACFNLSVPLYLCSLHSTFKYFSVLKPSDISVRVLRSANSKSGKQTIVSLSVFRTRFTMLLTPGTHVLHPQAQAKLVDGRGRETPFKIDRSLFFSGTVKLYSNYAVDAAKLGRVWIIHIHTPQELLAIEPADFYDERANHRHMIAYKERDIRTDNHTHGESFCAEVSVNNLLRKIVRYEGKRNDWKYQNISVIPAHAGNNHKHMSRDRATVAGSLDSYYAKDYAHHKHSTEIIANHAPRGTGQTFPKTKTHAPENINASAIMKGHQHRLESKAERLEMTPTMNLSYPSSRGRRSFKPWRKTRTDCEILVLVDYTLFRGIGRRSETKIIATLLQIYRLIDRIFRKTDFGEEKTGYGVVVSGFRIHTEPSDYGYNAPSDDATRILSAMAIYESFLQYCLIHLSVQRRFGNKIGLAPVAKPSGFLQGICGQGSRSAIEGAHNIGLTTVLDTQGIVFTMRAYSVVVAHEIGHNWGANHDPKMEDGKSHPCSPTSAEGGKYIMYPYFGHTRNYNSDRFSSCSRTDISKILKMRAHRCFLSKRNLAELCGNGLVDPPEDCDPGFDGLARGDRCCTEQCRFSPGAVCSPSNDICCTEDCQVANSSRTCYPTGIMEDEACYTQSSCLGNSSWECPQSPALPNKTPCGDQGWCWHGRCLSFCERLGMSMDPPRDFRPCQCDHSRAAMCLHCCIERFVPQWRKKRCMVMGGRVREGSPCLKGRCSNGTCKYHNYRDDIHRPRFFLSSDSANFKAAILCYASLSAAILVGDLFSVSLGRLRGW